LFSNVSAGKELGRIIVSSWESLTSQHLHRQGSTIIQVTHDREKAEYSERIIRLKDGLVENVEVVPLNGNRRNCGLGFAGCRLGRKGRDVY